MGLNKLQLSVKSVSTSFSFTVFLCSTSNKQADKITIYDLQKTSFSFDFKDSVFPKKLLNCCLQLFKLYSKNWKIC